MVCWHTYGPWWIFQKLANANIHGLSQSVQLYATSATTSGTIFCQETHIASPIDFVNQVCITFPNDRSTPGARGFGFEHRLICPSLVYSEMAPEKATVLFL